MVDEIAIARSAPTRAIRPESAARSDELSTSDEWALDISLERFKADCVDLLREYSADEVCEILAERRGRQRAPSPAA